MSPHSRLTGLVLLQTLSILRKERYTRWSQRQLIVDLTDIKYYCHVHSHDHGFPPGDGSSEPKHGHILESLGLDIIFVIDCGAAVGGLLRAGSLSR
jgi:hypothetical protein